MSRQCLSPLICGSLLQHIDAYFAAREEVFYARYMDDFTFFTKTRWHLHKAIKSLYKFFALGGFEAHPDKTQLGKIDKGFDWLGIWYSPLGPQIALRAFENHREHRALLYEQARRRKLSKTEAERRMHAYEVRWIICANHHLKAAECSRQKKSGCRIIDGENHANNNYLSHLNCCGQHRGGLLGSLSCND